MNWLVKNWGKVVTFALLALVGMRLLDLLMLWGLFNSFTSRFRGLGITNDYLVNAMSVAMMTIVALLLHHLVWKFFLRRTQQGTLIFGAAITAWMLLMYFVSIPKAGEYFNPVTGQPRFVYTVLPNGEIDIKPLGYKYHPKTGEGMVPLTKDVMKQHADKILRFEQHKPTISSAPNMQPPFQTLEYPRFRTNPILSRGHGEIRFRWESYPQTCAEMHINSIQTTTEDLYMRLEFKNACAEGFLSLFKPQPNDTYVVSDTGEALRISTCHKDAFPDTTMPDVLRFFDKRTLIPYEVWRLGIWFPPLTQKAKYLTLTYQNFDKVEIALLN